MSYDDLRVSFFVIVMNKKLFKTVGATVGRPHLQKLCRKVFSCENGKIKLLFLKKSKKSSVFGKNIS